MWKTIIYFRKHNARYVMPLSCTKSNVNYWCNLSTLFSKYLFSSPWMLSIAIWTWRKELCLIQSLSVASNSSSNICMCFQWIITTLCIWPASCVPSSHGCPFCMLSAYFSPLLYRHDFFCLTHSFSSSLKPFPKQSRQSWPCCRGSCWAMATFPPPSSPVSSPTT